GVDAEEGARVRGHAEGKATAWISARAGGELVHPGTRRGCPPRAGDSARRWTDSRAFIYRPPHGLASGMGQAQRKHSAVEAVLGRGVAQVCLFSVRHRGAILLLLLLATAGF